MSLAHHTPYAGSWYPADPTELGELMDQLFERSERRIGAGVPGRAAGFVVPHAGPVYSGAVAAGVYRQLARQKPKRVILLGFTHRGAPPGLSIPDVPAYRTPLGEVRVDRRSVSHLLATGLAEARPESSLCDHSVEIQLPYLQRVVPEAEVIPLYVSNLDRKLRRKAAAQLAQLLDRDTVILASSDFTHYGASFHYQPFPHNSRTAEQLRRLDEGFIRVAGSLDAELLLSTLESQSATVCGRQPIALLTEVIRALPDGEDHFQQTLDYETSGDITGDYSHCVSYAALGYFPWRSFLLSEQEGRALIESARETLRVYQESGRTEPVPPAPDSEAIHRKTGCFVTLHRAGRLRGCVGRITPTEAISETVPAMALAAALEDSRFEPLSRDETDIDIEVSVLSPMKLLADRSRFRVGTDGGYLEAGGISGLLLPQVAEGREWSAGDFLDALARKASLDASVYEDLDARLSVFRAQVIR